MEFGCCYWLRVYEILEVNKILSGWVIQNILVILKDDSIKVYINIQDLMDEEFINNNNIVFCICNGLIKKMLVEVYFCLWVGGINVIIINEGDQLIEVKLINGN